MGTSADFYVGRGPNAEWIGSQAFDGHACTVAPMFYGVTSEDGYRLTVREHLAKLDHATQVADGWPWPWENSQTTDYAYAFDEGRTWGTLFGRGWWPVEAEPEGENTEPKVEFPDMSAIKNVTFGHRSGVMVIGFG